MQPKVGELIKAVMPVFPEEVFPADSHILKDALANKQKQLAEKFGKYGSMSALPADLSQMSMPAGLGDMSMPSDMSQLADMARDSLMGSASMPDAASFGGLQDKALALASGMGAGFIADKAAAMMGGQGMAALPASVFEPQGFSADALAGAAQSHLPMDKLASMGVSPEMAASMSQEQLAALASSPGSMMSSEQMAALSADKLSEMGAMPEGLNAETLADPGAAMQNAAMQNIDASEMGAKALSASPMGEKLENSRMAQAAGLTGASSDESSMADSGEGNSGMDNDGVDNAEMESGEIDSATSDNPSAQAAAMAATGINSEGQQGENLSAASISGDNLNAESLAAVGLSPAIAAKMTPEQLSQAGVSPEQIEQIKALSTPQDGVPQMANLSEKLPPEAMGKATEMQASLAEKQGKLAGFGTGAPAADSASATFDGAGAQNAQGELLSSNLSNNSEAGASFDQNQQIQQSQNLSLSGSAVESTQAGAMQQSTSASQTSTSNDVGAFAMGASSRSLISKKPSMPANTASDESPSPSSSKAASQSSSATDTSVSSLVLVDELSRPVCGQKYELTLPDGKVIKGSTDENGRANFDFPISAACRLSLPALDQQAWA